MRRGSMRTNMEVGSGRETQPAAREAASSISAAGASLGPSRCSPDGSHGHLDRAARRQNCRGLLVRRWERRGGDGSVPIRRRSRAAMAAAMGSHSSSPSCRCGRRRRASDPASRPIPPRGLQRPHTPRAFEAHLLQVGFPRTIRTSRRPHASPACIPVSLTLRRTPVPPLRGSGSTLGSAAARGGVVGTGQARVSQ